MSSKTVFFGCDSQVGTTMLALSAAELLAKSGHRVLFLSTGSAPGNDFIDGLPVTSLDDLRGGLMDETLTAAELGQTLVESRGVDVLPGVRSWNSSKAYTTEHFRTILRLTGENWDHIIIDGGSGNPEGMTAAAWDDCSNLFLVATQQEKTLARYGLRRSAMDRPGGRKPWYIVNKFNSSGAFYNGKEMAQRLACQEPELIFIPYIPYGWQAEAERTTLLKFRRFRKGMQNVIRCIEGGAADGKQHQKT